MAIAGNGDGGERRRTGLAAREAPNGYATAGMYSGRILRDKDDACHGCVREFHIMRAFCPLRYDGVNQPVSADTRVRAPDRRLSP